MTRRVAVVGILVAVGALLAGCARPTVSQWGQSSGVVGLDSTLTGDVHDVFGAAHAHKQSQLIVTICDALYQDANQAYDTALPSPNTKINNELSTAYDDLVNGAQACSLDVGGSDAAATARAYAQLANGLNELTAATSDLAALGVH